MKISRPFQHPACLRAVALSVLCLCGTAQAQSLDYLRSLLDATPAGGWVKANTNLWSDAWPTGSTAVGSTGFGGGTPNVVHAWSSMAWDSTRNSLLLWGGGHSSYAGNEMYVWNGGTGAWTRGSLPSRVESVSDIDYRTTLVVDDRAPQSAHTYEGNLYLPVNDMFLTLGGPVFQNAGTFQVRDANGNLVTAGPWLWDPRKADANKVGGTTGSGWDSSSLGGEMWTNRGGNWVNPPEFFSFMGASTAYRTENGKDVVYVAVKPGAWPTLYKYTLGDVHNGGVDTRELVGVPSYAAASTESSATIDNRHNLYVNTAWHPDFAGRVDLNVWDLAKAGETNKDQAIDLVMRDGTAFDISTEFAINYSEADGALYLWDGNDRGTLYRTRATYNADGTLASQWLVDKLDSTTQAQPEGNHRYGVHGKWQYVEALDAFVALDEYSALSGDAEVWFYKPMAAAVPEPGSTALLLAGLGLLGLKLRRRAPMSPA